MSKNNESGFSIAYTLLLIIIGIIGLAGWYVLDKDNKPSTNNQTDNNQTPPSKSNQAEKWKTISSTPGKFSVSYPESRWGVVVQDSSPPSAHDVQTIEFRSVTGKVKGRDVVNRYFFQLAIRDKLYVPPSKDQLASGVITDLGNDISIWEQKKHVVNQNGTFEIECPELRLVHDKSFQQKVGSNYLEGAGSYCWTQGQSTTYSYEEQKESKEYLEMLDILKTIEFGK